MTKSPSERSAAFRQESDSLGTQNVPLEAYYGVQTVRAKENFPISGVTIGDFPDLIRAIAMVKKAAALANHELGQLPDPQYQAILAACDDVIKGKIKKDQFPVDVFQGGAGTSTNMNLNEVIANRALEILGKSKGDYVIVSPNDHINLSQSTNDVYPTGLRLAIALWAPRLRKALLDLSETFYAKGQEFKEIVKLGRTQLQDAVPMTLGQEFSGFGWTLREDADRLMEAAALLREINIGGTAIGTSLNASPEYRAAVLKHLREISGVELWPSHDLIEASWDAGAYVTFSGVLKRISVKLSKISNDLRLLSSGPRGGLGEIKLPPMQPGSSIMPGKVNPVIPECVNQVCFHVMGADIAVTAAAEGGQLQLNAFEPVIAYNILSSMKLLERVLHTFQNLCVKGIEAQAERCENFAHNSIALATALNPVLGYEKSAKIAKEALASGRSVYDVALEMGLSASQLDVLLDLKEMAMAREPSPKV